MFDLSITKILILAVIGLMIFGPEQLPRIASQAGAALRNLRRLAESAKADLTEGLGPEFRDFDFNDLNPRNLVRKHLFDDVSDEDRNLWSEDDRPAAPVYPASSAGSLEVGEVPPYDAEAT